MTTDDGSIPPKTVEEFMALNRLSEWPHRITSENIPELRETLDTFASEDGIMRLLEDAVSVDLKPLKEINDRLMIFNNQLLCLADKFLDLSDNVATHRADVAETDVENFVSSKTTNEVQAGKDVVARMKLLESRAVQNCQAPTFCTDELSPLPGNLEPRQIMNDVLNLQPFAPAIRPLMKKVFLSEASIAMLHDAFWWTFIDRFQPEKTHDRSKLFDRLSDTFVALCYSISAQVKDKVLLAYADCLAQAIYAVYARAFPASMLTFDSDFKQSLINITFEWITGFQPSVGVWLSWNLSILELQEQRADNEVAELSLIVGGGTWQTPDIDGMHRTVQSLEVVANSNDSEDTMTTSNKISKSAEKTTLSESFQPAFIGKSKESHPVGQGAVFERVLFGLNGQSVLVSHFLKMRQLQAKEFHARKVRHTRVKTLPSPDALTYNQMLVGFWRKHSERKKKYNSRLEHIKNATEERIAKLQSALSADSSGFSENLSDLSDDDSV